jgi:hypothetical protein
MLRYQAIKSINELAVLKLKYISHNYSFDARKKIRNENVQRNFCQENLCLPFAVRGNVKLKLPSVTGLLKKRDLQ